MFKFTRLRMPAFVTNSVLTTIAGLSIIGMTVQTAHAIHCGDTIVTDTTLDTDLGPCPGNGLVIGGPQPIPTNVTLDLNGHAIRGSDTGYGVLIGGGIPGLVIVKGAGTITHFATGIGVGPGLFGSSLIYNLVLNKNQTGILLYKTTGSPMWGQQRMLNNTITGKNQESIGIHIQRGNNIYLYQNTIRGHAVGVKTESEVIASIDENHITHNGTGISTFHTTNTCYFIRGNKIKHNDGDGIQTGVSSALAFPEIAGMPVTCIGATIENNTVSSNGGSGIVIHPYLDFSQLVQDNVVSENGANGISITSSSEANTSVQVIGNLISGNGTDLFWDGIALNVCGLQNIFDTSSLQKLPACQ